MDDVMGTADDGNIVTIYMNRVKNNFKSEQQDDLIFDDIPFIRIVSPGQRHSVVDRKLREDDKTTYAEHWRAFEKKEALRTNGTPLRDWSGVNNEQIRDLEFLNIYTVEDLSHVSDSNLVNIGPGALKLRERAEKFLAGDPESVVKLQQAEERNAKLEAEIEGLKAQVQKLMDAHAANPEQDEVQDVVAVDSTGHTERSWGLRGSIFGGGKHE